jgi:hypothetical protein
MPPQVTDENVVAIPLEERMARVRKAVQLINDHRVSYRRRGGFKTLTLPRSLVYLFCSAYDGRSASVMTNSSFYRALEQVPGVLETLGSLVYLTVNQQRYIKNHFDREALP